jgi:hypothetical protein
MKFKEISAQAIYLDVCALCRSFDDQRYLRIRLETAAIELIMERIKYGDYSCYYSPVHFYEIEEFDDPFERSEVQNFLLLWGLNAGKKVTLRMVRQRAEELSIAGFSAGDAAHAAFAEALDASFITCDDKLIKLCRRFNLSVWFGTPVEFCEKEQIK